MKLAIVYDRVNKWGGAERVLLALHEIWPEAPLFTAVYDKKRAAWANVFQVHPSFLQHIPFAKRHHELYPWLTSMAFESFSWDAYDVVVSVTSAEAKDIITKPGTVHICYCLTPTRYLWSAKKEYEASGFAGKVLHNLAPMLKKWDIIASARPDYYLAISKRVGHRIEKYYQRKVEQVIYPPVDTEKFKINEKLKMENDNYFLCVSRLVPYKRVDIVIDAFNQLGWALKIIGSGRSERSLKKRANSNIEFVGGDLTDTALVAYYQRCRAFVFAGEEDFGLVSLEAQACGKPVICYRASGMAETVIDGKSGLLFDRETPECLVDALHTFSKEWYDSGFCRKNAQRFDLKHFKDGMRKIVEELAKQKI
ncbi:MAG: glycosyltransferase [Candidatus Gottesmanbacteria bacterium]|nr:glycosyltransferase [Candidatus Gottesmanbacteria bacterium]